MIDIGTVLKKFDNTVDDTDFTVKEYGIRFITSDGRLRTMIARKNVKDPKRALRGPLQDRGKTMFNLKRNGTMLVQDIDLGQPRAVKVSAITQFKDFRSTEWHNVFH
jgi:hypothetical protein